MARSFNDIAKRDWKMYIDIDLAVWFDTPGTTTATILINDVPIVSDFSVSKAGPANLPAELIEPPTIANEDFVTQVVSAELDPTRVTQTLTIKNTGTTSTLQTQNIAFQIRKRYRNGVNDTNEPVAFPQALTDKFSAFLAESLAATDAEVDAIINSTEYANFYDSTPAAIRTENITWITATKNDGAVITAGPAPTGWWGSHISPGESITFDFTSIINDRKTQLAEPVTTP